MDLNRRLKWLKARGCHPCISRRGSLWRAHVNGSGNYWAEGPTPHQAMEEAVQLWDSKGRPMDGYGAST